MQPLAALVEEPLLLAAAVEEPHLLAAAVEGPLLLAVPEGEEVAQCLAVQEVVAPEAHEVLVRLVRLGHHLLQLLMCGHHLGLPNRSLVRVKIGSSSEGLPAKSNSPSRADQGLASSEMPSSDPLTPLPEIEDFQSDVDMREEYQKDPDGCRQDQGAIAEPGVECELEDDAVRKAVEGESTAGDQPGEGANLVVNNGNTSNAKGTSHQISHLEEDISNQGKVPQVNFCKQAYKCIDNKGTVPIAKVRVRPQPRKKNPDVNAASSEGPLNTVEGQRES